MDKCGGPNFMSLSPATPAPGPGPGPGVWA